MTQVVSLHVYKASEFGPPEVPHSANTLFTFVIYFISLRPDDQSHHSSYLLLCESDQNHQFTTQTITYPIQGAVYLCEALLYITKQTHKVPILLF
jgi:hypothetical protein